jgi:cytochrome b subunit of formate dehydrogenase
MLASIMYFGVDFLFFSSFFASSVSNSNSKIIHDFVGFALSCYLHCLQLVFVSRMIWQWNNRFPQVP